MATTVASRKAKGRKLQQFVRDIFRDIFKNILEDGDLESRQMGGSGTDIVMSPAAKKLIPFDFEIKNQEKLNITEAIKQAESNTVDGRIPIVVFSRNRDKVYAVLEFEKLVKLMYPDWKSSIIIDKNQLKQKENIQNDQN